MPITYTVQPSVLKPEGEVVDYGRYMVVNTAINPETAELSTNLQTVANCLQNGNIMRIFASDDTLIGELIPTLGGSFPLSDAPTPTSANMQIGFKPSKSLISEYRQAPSFIKAETVVRLPMIITFESAQAGSDVFYPFLRVSTSIPTIVRIKGMNLGDSPASFTATSGTDTDSAVASIISNTSLIFTDVFDNLAGAAPAPTTATIALTCGTKVASEFVVTLWHEGDPMPTV